MAFIAKPKFPYILDAAKARANGVFWLSLFDGPGQASELISGRSLSFTANSAITYSSDEEGNSAVCPGTGSATTNGTSLAIPFPAGATVPDNIIIAARIKLTNTSLNPSAAFGIWSTLSNCGSGIGFNATNSGVGGIWLGGSGTNLGAYSPASQNIYYTVYAQLYYTSGTYFSKAWINGLPATTNQGGTGAAGSANTISTVGIGAGVNAGGFLRWFPGRMQWGALLYLPGAAQSFIMTDALAGQMYASNFPYNLLLQPKPRFLNSPAAGTTVSPGAGSVTFTGFSPSISIGQTLFPGVGAVSISGKAPTVRYGTTVSPGKGSVVVTGYAPVVLAPGPAGSGTMQTHLLKNTGTMMGRARIG